MMSPRHQRTGLAISRQRYRLESRTERRTAGLAPAIAVAIAETRRRGEDREHGKIANTPTAFKGLVSRLTRSGAALQFCYEAGPCGYRIQRQLTAAAHGCVVVAPSLIPRKPGDRIKTDRQDATNLTNLHRAGELTLTDAA